MNSLQEVATDVQRFYGCGLGVAEAFEDGEAVPRDDVGDDRSRAPKTIVIRQADWLKYEGTTGCPKCIHARDHGWGKMGGPHSPACVQRFQKLFEETAEGQLKLARAKEKQDQWQASRKTEDAPRGEAPERPTPVRFEAYEPD